MALTKIKLNTMVTGTLADANIPDSITIDNAATATALETARTIHGVSFDGTSDIDLTEAIQDVVGGMVASNTETNIAVTYDDTNGKLDFASTDTTYSVGDGGLTQNNFTDALKTKLDGIAASANNYSLPLATSSTRGGVKIGYTENGKNYPVELDSEKMYVNVPWTDTNTTYSVGDGGLTQNNFTDALKSKLDGIETGATADQTKADIDALNINADLLDGQHGSYYQAASSAITTSNISSQSVSSATAAVRLNGFDNRVISPSEFGNTRVRFGFTSYANNNSSPYADAFHMSSYGDSSGGSANLVMFKKSGIGMRIWQQSFNSSSAYSTYEDVWHTGNDGSGSGLDADLLDGNHASAFVRTNTTSVITGGQALQFSPSTGGFPKINMDARTSGSGARIHRWNRDNNDSNYLPYYENWYDGNSYQTFGTESNKWVFEQQIRIADAYGNAYFGGNQSDEWGRIEFSDYGNGTYVYTGSGSFRVDGGHWYPYSNADTDLGADTLRWRNLYVNTTAKVGQLQLNNNFYLRQGSVDYGEFSSWLQGSGGHGIYFPSTSDTASPHFYPNNGYASYGTFRVTNGSGGYPGMIMGSHSNKPTFMVADSTSSGGLYYSGTGRWAYYHNYGHNCLGIGSSTTSSSYELYVHGDVYATGSYSNSDIRMKENIETIDSGIDKVMNMRGVYFDWINKEKGEGRQTGVIAQELAMVLPEAVVHAEDIDEYSVDYSKITGVLIEAIKDLKNEINELKGS